MLNATLVGQTITAQEVSTALLERGYYPSPVSPAVSPPLSPAYPEIPVDWIAPEPPYIGPVSPSVSPAVIVAGAKSPWLLILLLGGLILLSGKDRRRVRA